MSACQISQKVLTIEKLFASEQSHLSPCSAQIHLLDQNTVWGSAAEMSHGTVSISHSLAEIPACFPAVPIWTPVLPATGLGK